MPVDMYTVNFYAHYFVQNTTSRDFEGNVEDDDTKIGMYVYDSEYEIICKLRG